MWLLFPSLYVLNGFVFLSILLICTFLFLTVLLKNGLPTCIKGSQLVSISHSSEIIPMIGTKSCSWLSLEVSCHHCISLTRQGMGIYCANFGKPVIGLPLCHCSWCVPCYHRQPGTDFLVYTDRNVTMAPIPNEENNYIQAHEGGPLFCPYECDECSFYCITGSLAFVQMLIIKYCSIIPDVLILTHSGHVQRIQYENSNLCSLKISN